MRTYLRSIIFGGIILLCIFSVLYYIKRPPTTRVKIGANEFTVDVVVSTKEITKGLGYRDQLPSKHGMLFIFDHKDTYSFWMKGMRFPLDMIWIDGITIVDISHDVPVAVNNVFPTYKPVKPVDKVLEVNSGIAKRYDIKIGDRVLFLQK